MSIASAPAIAGLPSPTRLVSAGVTAIADAIGPAVVVVGHRGGGGAGVIWQADGLIVTNRHVARADTQPITLADGRELAGQTVARHPDRDLALIRVDAAGLPTAPAADSDQVRPGQLVFAFGHPIGYRDAVTTGVVVAAGRTTTPEGPRSGDWLQTDVTLLPGNSGGPLVNAAGEVIGISTMIAGQLSLGVPSNTVTAFVDDYLQPHVAVYLGLTGFVVDLPAAAQRAGFIVTAVAPDSPSSAAGLLLGDVITRLADFPIEDQESLPAATLRLAPNVTVAVAFIRAGVVSSTTLVPVARTSPD